MLLDGFFSAGQGGYYLLVLVFMALLVGLYLWGRSRREKNTRADELQNTYREMTADKLAAVPDDQLVDAVIANLMAKLDPHHPDPYRTIPMLSHGRCVVYSVWLLCRELDNAGFEELLESPSSAFCALGADGFDTLGAVRCAEAVRAALRIEEEEELAERHADFLEAMQDEQPLARCVDFIRDNAPDFLDEDSEDDPVSRGE